MIWREKQKRFCEGRRRTRFIREERGRENERGGTLGETDKPASRDRQSPGDKDTEMRLHREEGVKN